jgi:hypothetical protein
VFADPAYAGLAGEGLFQHRTGIDEHAVSHRTDPPDDVVSQSLQGLAQHLVIVAAQRVAGDVAHVLIGKRLAGRACATRLV